MDTRLLVGKLMQHKVISNGYRMRRGNSRDGGCTAALSAPPTADSRAEREPVSAHRRLSRIKKPPSRARRRFEGGGAPTAWGAGSLSTTDVTKRPLRRSSRDSLFLLVNGVMSVGSRGTGRRTVVLDDVPGGLAHGQPIRDPCLVAIFFCRSRPAPHPRRPHSHLRSITHGSHSQIGTHSGTRRAASVQKKCARPKVARLMGGSRDATTTVCNAQPMSRKLAA